MNSTNRAANRIFVIVVGAMMLAAGAAVVALAADPARGEAWLRAGRSLERGLSEASWPLPATPFAAAVVIAALLVFVFRQGRGRTDQLVSALPLPTGTAAGTLTVDVAVAADVLRRALSRTPALMGVGVSAYRVGRRPALKLTLTPRRGVEPRSVLPQVERAIAEWDELLGQRVPVLVHLGAGVRTAFSAPARTGRSG